MWDYALHIIPIPRYTLRSATQLLTNVWAFRMNAVSTLWLFSGTCVLSFFVGGDRPWKGQGLALQD